MSGEIHKETGLREILSRSVSAGEAVGIILPFPALLAVAVVLAVYVGVGLKLLLCLLCFMEAWPVVTGEARGARPIAKAVVLTVVPLALVIMLPLKLGVAIVLAMIFGPSLLAATGSTARPEELDVAKLESRCATGRLLLIVFVFALCGYLVIDLPEIVGETAPDDSAAGAGYRAFMLWFFSLLAGGAYFDSRLTRVKLLIVKAVSRHSESTLVATMSPVETKVGGGAPAPPSSSTGDRVEEE